MGRDAAQITREIDQTRAELAITIADLRNADVKGQVKAKADDLRHVAVTKGKAKARELQPVLRARAQAKVRELRPLAQAKADDVKTTALATGREKVHELKPVAIARVQELKPVAIARAKEKAADLTPVVVAAAKAKVDEVKPVVVARANAGLHELKAKARSAALTKAEDAKAATLDGAADIGHRALDLAKSKPTLVAGSSAFAGGLLLLASRRIAHWRSRTALDRLTTHADAVNRQAIARIHRVRRRAADGLHHGADAPRRLGRRLRRG